MNTLYRNDQPNDIVRQVLAAMMALILLSAFVPGTKAHAELVVVEEIEEETELYDEPDWEEEYVILDDPAYFMTDEELDEIDYVDYAGTGGSTFDSDIDEGVEETSAIPVITSVGKKNVRVNGVKSKNKLLEYTIPEELLAADPNFLALMVEAEKYIGYPYVYGESNPKRGFDCGGFVSWVFIHSGVYNTGSRGANGLHNLCTEISREEARPGDLIFFQGTMGKDVKGITHVGIYVGNNMMIHAGDPVGFADLTDEKWVKRYYCMGRLPID